MYVIIGIDVMVWNHIELFVASWARSYVHGTWERCKSRRFATFRISCAIFDFELLKLLFNELEPLPIMSIPILSILLDSLPINPPFRLFRLANAFGKWSFIPGKFGCCQRFQQLFHDSCSNGCYKPGRPVQIRNNALLPAEAGCVIPVISLLGYMDKLFSFGASFGIFHCTIHCIGYVTSGFWVIFLYRKVWIIFCILVWDLWIHFNLINLLYMYYYNTSKSVLLFNVIYYILYIRMFYLIFLIF